MKAVTLDGYEVEITNRDKVLFPDAGITKGEFVEYYRRIADVMIPHIRDRAVTMRRFPDGIGGQGFYHKNIPDHFPDWLDTVTVEKEGGEVTHAVCNHPAALVYLANFGTITPHIWLSRRDEIRKPDRLIFDLDPTTTEFQLVRRGARRLAEVLSDAGLEPFIMTTGSRGVHVVCPIERSLDFDEVRRLARRVAKQAAEKCPEELTTEVRKNKRGDRVFIDFLRNAYAQTAVPPYAVRAREGAPVATPIDWGELGDSGLRPDKYTIRNIFRRMGRKSDPWKDIDRHARPLEKAAERMAAA